MEKSILLSDAKWELGLIKAPPPPALFERETQQKVKEDREINQQRRKRPAWGKSLCPLPTIPATPAATRWQLSRSKRVFLTTLSNSSSCHLIAFFSYPLPLTLPVCLLSAIQGWGGRGNGTEADGQRGRERPSLGDPTPNLGTSLRNIKSQPVVLYH